MKESRLDIRILLFALFSLCSNKSLAQDFVVEKFESLKIGEWDTTDVIEDNNGDTCALVRIYIEGTEPIFDGGIVGKPKYKNDCYYVNLVAGSKFIRVSQFGTAPTEVRFSEYGIPSLKPGFAYTLVFVNNTHTSVFPKIETIPIWNSESANSPLVISLIKEAETFENQDNPLEAYSKYYKAAMYGNVSAISKTVKYFEYGCGNKNDEVSLLPIILGAAKALQPRAIAALGDFYFSGWGGLEKSYYLAAKYFKKASEIGDTYAITSLGVMYQLGLGVAEDKQNAFELYRIAMEKGDPHGIRRVASCYLYGVEGVVEKDYAKAIELYNKALKADNKNAFALKELSTIYLNGYGVSTDVNKAIQLLQEAAIISNEESSILYELGSIFEKDGVGQPEKAKDYYLKSATKNNVYAQHRLGVAYFNGELGIKKDYSESLKWFLKSGNNDGALSATASWIAYIYENGLAGERNRSMAKLWYEKGLALGEKSYKDEIKRLKYIIDYTADDSILDKVLYLQHEYVDLGLPSGTMWASYNLGSNKPEDFGGYYAWGEIKTKTEYNKDNYDFLQQENLQKECDVANKQWGGGWHIPTKEDFAELLANCIHRWTKQGGVKGCLLTSIINKKSIFLPAADVFVGSKSSGENRRCVYNTSTYAGFQNDNHEVFCFYYLKDGLAAGNNVAHIGSSIRPVFYTK